MVPQQIDWRVQCGSGSCLSPLLFITVLEAFSQEFCNGCPWENLYVIHLVIITESQEELQEKLILWKNNIERKGLLVNMGKAKIPISSGDLCALEIRQRPLCHGSQGRQHKLPFSVLVIQLASPEMQTVSLALWILISASCVNGVLGWPDQ